MGILNGLKNFTKNQDERNSELLKNISNVKFNYPKNSTIGYSVIDFAPNIYLTHIAMRTCIGKKSYPLYSQQKEQVKRVLGLGGESEHESVLEHSNIISLLYIPKENIKDYLLMSSSMNYCHTKIKIINETAIVLIGGSIRAYFNILRYTSIHNQIYFAIKSIIEQSVEKELLVKIIKSGIIDENDCDFIPYDFTRRNDCSWFIKGDQHYSCKQFIGNRVDMIYTSIPEFVYEKIRKFGFSKNDAFKVCTISLMFHNVSRSCANQMTRHRVAISQESQRYVTHETKYMGKDSSFINTIELNKKYDNKYNDINIEGYPNDFDPFIFYSALIDSGILKEDARGWLPMNSSTKLFMTFTYSQLSHFIYLRSGKGAQLEVRLIAEELNNIVENHTSVDKDELFKINDYTFMEDEQLKDINNKPITITSNNIDEGISQIDDEIDYTPMKSDKETLEKLINNNDKN